MKSHKKGDSTVAGSANGSTNHIEHWTQVSGISVISQYNRFTKARFLGKHVISALPGKLEFRLK